MQAAGTLLTNTGGRFGLTSRRIRPMDAIHSPAQAAKSLVPQIEPFCYAVFTHGCDLVWVKINPTKPQTMWELRRAAAKKANRSIIEVILSMIGCAPRLAFKNFTATDFEY